MLSSRCLTLLVVGLFLLTTFAPSSAFDARTECLYDAEPYDLDGEGPLDEVVPIGYVSVVASASSHRTDPTPLTLIQSPPASRAPPAS
jgi:hypothetical protein